MARGKSFPDSVWLSILEQIADGKPLREICRQDGMPGYWTVYAYRNENEEYRKLFTESRDCGFDVIADESLEIIDAATPENIQVAKARADHRLKLLAKWSNRYSDKITNEHTGPNGGPMQTDNKWTVEFVRPKPDQSKPED